VVVVEDDHSGEIAATADLSLATHLPHQTVHVRSYSKSHGPDLRLAAVGGPADIVEPLLRRRHLGPGWSSRLLQGLLLDLLEDAAAAAAVTRAREEYEHRRAALRTALAERGVTSSPGSGVNLWICVDNEHTALITLAAAGIRASPGGPFLVAPLGADHIRVTSGLLHDGLESVADHIAAAAAPGAGMAGMGGTRRRGRSGSTGTR
jgi:DNA-binding transcriptional MocR family regulator